MTSRSRNGGDLMTLNTLAPHLEINRREFDRVWNKHQHKIGDQKTQIKTRSKLGKVRKQLEKNRGYCNTLFLTPPLLYLPSLLFFYFAYWYMATISTTYTTMWNTKTTVSYFLLPYVAPLQAQPNRRCAGARSAETEREAVWRTFT